MQVLTRILPTSYKQRLVLYLLKDKNEKEWKTREQFMLKPGSFHHSSCLWKSRQTEKGHSLSLIKIIFFVHKQCMVSSNIVAKSRYSVEYRFSGKVLLQVIT